MPRIRFNRFSGDMSSEWARSAPQPDKGKAFVRRLRIRFPGLPLKIKAGVL